VTTGSYIKHLKKQLILKKASKPKGDIMGKGKDAKKNVKKEPAKTPKEKKSREKTKEI
jgi:hypothetical protein